MLFQYLCFSSKQVLGQPGFCFNTFFKFIKENKANKVKFLYSTDCLVAYEEDGDRKRRKKFVSFSAMLFFGYQSGLLYHLFSLLSKVGKINNLNPKQIEGTFFLFCIRCSWKAITVYEHSKLLSLKSNIFFIVVQL